MITCYRECVFQHGEVEYTWDKKGGILYPWPGTLCYRYEGQDQSGCNDTDSIIFIHFIRLSLISHSSNITYSRGYQPWWIWAQLNWHFGNWYVWWHPHLWIFIHYHPDSGGGWYSQGPWQLSLLMLLRRLLCPVPCRSYHYTWLICWCVFMEGWDPQLVLGMHTGSLYIAVGLW